jgi:hypothetical protein
MFSDGPRDETPFELKNGEAAPLFWEDLEF